MSSFRKAFSWGRRKPNIGEVTSQLRILSKQLERQRNKLEKEERGTKSRAIKARKSGNLEAYKVYATEMIRFRRFALSVDKSRLQILKILAHVTRAQSTAQASKALEQVAQILGLLGDATDASKVVDNADEIARRLEEFEIESGITGEAFDSTGDAAVTSEDIAVAMREIDAEAGMGEAAVTGAPVSESDKLEEAIKNLERELGV
ncbi:MAG: Snf7 family protein [Candidatus Thorarchaeota archaeon]|nr:Snf7 family protein [Candidatus Thorarchaeota archaeon]